MFKKFYIQSKNENENPQNQFPEFSWQRSKYSEITNAIDIKQLFTGRLLLMVLIKPTPSR